MNWIDYIILGLLLFSTIIGMTRGLVKELLSLIFFIVAIFIAMKYSAALAAYFGQTNLFDNVSENASQPVSYIILIISFLVLFIGTIIIGGIINFFINSLFQVGLLGVGNRFLGILFGFCRGIIIAVVMIFVLQFSPVANETAWQQSRLLPYFKPLVIKLNNFISPKLDELKEKLQKGINNLYGKDPSNI